MSSGTQEGPKNWIVRATPPKDWFSSATLSVNEWLQNHENSSKEAWADFMQAVCAVTHHEDWEWEIREQPRVGYDPVEDTHYFIFKIDNNGTTFFVSKREMKEIESPY